MEKDLVLLLTGFVVGVMNAIAGGGMLVGFPVLLWLGIPPLVANASGSIATMPGQFGSAFAYRKYLRKVPRVYLWLIIPIVVGAAFGALALRHTTAGEFERMVPGLVFFGIMLFAFQPLMHFHLHRYLHGRAKTQLPVLILGVAMLPLCFYGGYFGAGYGFLMLAFFGFTKLNDTHIINAMKNVSAIFVSITTIFVLFGAHMIDWRTGSIMACGSLVGGYTGARQAQRVSSQWLRIIIVFMGLCAVIYLSRKHY